MRGQARRLVDRVAVLVERGEGSATVTAPARDVAAALDAERERVPEATVVQELRNLAGALDEPQERAWLDPRGVVVSVRGGNLESKRVVGWDDLTGARVFDGTHLRDWVLPGVRKTLSRAVRRVERRGRASGRKTGW